MGPQYTKKLPNNVRHCHPTRQTTEWGMIIFMHTSISKGLITKIYKESKRAGNETYTHGKILERGDTVAKKHLKKCSTFLSHYGNVSQKYF